MTSQAAITPLRRSQPVDAWVELAGLVVERDLRVYGRAAAPIDDGDALARLALLGRRRRALPDELAHAIARAHAVASETLAPLGFEHDEITIVAVLLAVALDVDLERIVRWHTGGALDAATLARFAGGTDASAIDAARQRLHPQSRLMRLRFVVDHAIADRLLGHLTGEHRLDRDLADVARYLPATSMSELVVDPAIADALVAVFARGQRCVLVGDRGAGKPTLAAAAATSNDRALLHVTLDDDCDLRLGAIAREALLRRIAVAIEIPVDKPAYAERLIEWLAEIEAPVALIAERRPAWIPVLAPTIAELVVPPLDVDQRQLAWLRGLPGDIALAEQAACEIAARYTFGAGAITTAARHAGVAARRREPAEATLRDLSEAARAMFSHRLGELAQRIPTGFTWQDLVLPPDAEAEVREVISFARAFPLLLEMWGFAAKLPYGRGVSAILAGPPGTGKTMVAQLIADELGYELYRIDVSQVVNKYIGETEKNLAKLFAEAEGSQAILFFDEADSLFAKRTEVKSSNDRYANLEVNYLLQRMESYAGVTLLATNLEQGLDEAFRRRVRFTVELDLPDEATRAKLWKSMFPPQVPMARSIDWAGLGAAYELSGGYIKKAAVRAAATVATRGGEITTAVLHEAARAEYRAIGRIA